MKKLILAGIAAAALAVLGVPPASAREADEPAGSIQPAGNVQPADLPALAKVSFDDALRTARSACPGAVIKAKLEVDNGSLLYEFVIVGPNRAITEVEIDAGNGRVLSTEKSPGADGDGDSD